MEKRGKEKKQEMQGTQKTPSLSLSHGKKLVQRLLCRGVRV